MSRHYLGLALSQTPKELLIKNPRGVEALG